MGQISFSFGLPFGVISLHLFYFVKFHVSLTTGAVTMCTCFSSQSILSAVRFSLALEKLFFLKIDRFFDYCCILRLLLNIFTACPPSAVVSTSLLLHKVCRSHANSEISSDSGCHLLWVLSILGVRVFCLHFLCFFCIS